MFRPPGMNELRCIAYVSSAVRLLAIDELDALLTDARAFNASAGVTRVLLHHAGGFFQCFEGPPEVTAQVYDRIRKSRTHHTILELLDERTERRIFSNWLMGSSQVAESTALSLQSASWRRLAGGLRPGDRREPSGLVLLQEYWSTVPEASLHGYRHG